MLLTMPILFIQQTTDANILLTIFPIVLTSLMTLAVSLILIQNKKINKNDLSNAVIIQSLVEVKNQISEVKESVKDINEIKIELSKMQITMDNSINNHKRLEKNIYDAQRDIHNIKDSVTHIFKEIAIKNQ